MFTYQFNSMSTFVKIAINRELFANDLMPVYKWFETIEDTCSRFRQDSELSKLNEQVGKEVPISENLYLILKDADRFFKETDGLFNPGTLTAIENSGYRHSIEYIRNQNLEVSLIKPTGTIRGPAFKLNEGRQSVTLSARIDLGGIAKGWVIDRAAEELEKFGVGFINVGGDIRTFGQLPRPLNVGIESPFDPASMISSIQVRNGAIATSTSMKRKWLVNGELNHHLMDPRTGKPSNSNIVSATITAPTAVEADVWAKTVLLSGTEKAIGLIQQQGRSAVLISRTGEIWRGGE
jgi:thiamine biosynthesis lipoprotein